MVAEVGESKLFPPTADLGFLMLDSVSLPPQEAQSKLADQTLCVERTNPHSAVIVLGDFHKGNLIHEVPKYRDFLIELPTREENTLNGCYATISSCLSCCPTCCAETV